MSLSRDRAWSWWASACAAVCALSACKVFESTCAEDDRNCLGGGLSRSGESCLRSGDCAPGMRCENSLCVYAALTKDNGKCLVSAECAAGHYCSSELRCRKIDSVALTLGGACADSSGCARGLVCDVDLASEMEQGPFAALSDECRASVTELEVDRKCSLAKVCSPRGKLDFGLACRDSGECLAGLYCAQSPVDEPGHTSCLGGIALEQEPISLPNWTGASCSKDAKDAIAYFDLAAADSDSELDFYRLPYPNDIRLGPLGIKLGTHPAPPRTLSAIASRFLDAARARDGFSTNPVIYFRFSSAYDDDSLEGSTLLVDITPESPDYNAPQTLERGPAEASSRYICPHWLSLYRPYGAPLRPNTTYAAIVTRQVLSKTGKPFAPSPDFELMLDPVGPDAESLRSAWQAYAPLRAWLADERRELTDDLLNATVFTTGNPRAEVMKLKAAVLADGAPKPGALTPCRTGAVSPCEGADGRGACHPASADFSELHGKLSLPIFQAGEPPYVEPEAGGDIDHDDRGRPRVVRHEQVCFALSVPNTPQPADGFPLALYAHALGGVFNEAMAPGGLARDLARGPAPAALLSLELPEHGERRGDVTRLPEDLFVNLRNPAATRGNVLQGVADLFGLIALARGGIDTEATPDGVPIRFDRTRLALYGHGQGATCAALALAFDDRVRTVVLAALGGHVTTQLQRIKPSSFAALLPLLLIDVESKTGLGGGLQNPMLALIQSALDDIDPLNYADRLYRGSIPQGRDVFVVYGRDDHFVPEPAQQAFARAADLSAVQPDLSMRFSDLAPPVQNNLTVDGSQRTVALRQYEPKQDRVDPDLPAQDGHFVVENNKTARDDVVRFLTQALAGEAPSIGR